MRKILKYRIYAFLIDLIIIHFLKFSSLIIYLRTIGVFIGAVPIENKENLFTNLNLLNNYLLIVIFTGYFFSCFFITKGRTIGKQLFNLKLDGSKEKEIFIDQYLIRTFTYLFCYNYGMFLLLIPLVSKDGKGLPDWLSGTEVTQEGGQSTRNSDYNQNEAFNLRKQI